MKTGSEALRDELTSYVNSLASKLDSYGDQLVHFPDNFEEVVDLMDRDDLLAPMQETSDKKTSLNQSQEWVKHLFQDPVGFQYDGKDEKDLKERENEKLNRGLAEIYMLDKKLQKLHRLQNSNKILVEEATNFDDTFITKQKSSSVTPLHTSRSSLINRTDEPLEGVDAMNNSKDSNEMTPETSKTTVNAHESRRIDLLLDDDDVNEDEYILTLNKMREVNKDIDNKLETYGNISRIYGTDRITLPSKDRDHDYLTQQRKERAMKELERKLNEDLAAIIKQPINYYALCNLDNPERMDSSSTASKKSLLSVPQYSDVRIKKVVTQQDIELLIEEILSESSSPTAKPVLTSNESISHLLSLYQKEIEKLSHHRTRRRMIDYANQLEADRSKQRLEPTVHSSSVTVASLAEDWKSYLRTHSQLDGEAEAMGDQDDDGEVTSQLGDEMGFELPDPPRHEDFNSKLDDATHERWALPKLMPPGPSLDVTTKTGKVLEEAQWTSRSQSNSSSRRVQPSRRSNEDRVRGMSWIKDDQDVKLPAIKGAMRSDSGSVDLSLSAERTQEVAKMIRQINDLYHTNSNQKNINDMDSNRLLKSDNFKHSMSSESSYGPRNETSAKDNALKTTEDVSPFHEELLIMKSSMAMEAEVKVKIPSSSMVSSPPLQEKKKKSSRKQTADEKNVLMMKESYESQIKDIIHDNHKVEKTEASIHRYIV